MNPGLIRFLAAAVVAGALVFGATYLVGCGPTPGSPESARQIEAAKADRQKRCGHMPEGNAKLCCEFPGMCR